MASFGANFDFSACVKESDFRIEPEKIQMSEMVRAEIVQKGQNALTTNAWTYISPAETTVPTRAILSMMENIDLLFDAEMDKCVRTSSTMYMPSPRYARGIPKRCEYLLVKTSEQPAACPQTARRSPDRYWELNQAALSTPIRARKKTTVAFCFVFIHPHVFRGRTPPVK